jgi:hypothetical protein
MHGCVARKHYTFSMSISDKSIQIIDGGSLGLVAVNVYAIIIVLCIS